MRSTDPWAAVGVMGLVAILALAPTSAWADHHCLGSGAIDDQGGEAAVDCSGDDPVTPAGSRRATECTFERAADPGLWWLSYDVPDEVIPRDGPTQSYALNPPQGQVLGVYRDCYGEVRSGLLWVPEPAPGGAGDVEGLFLARQEARARVEPAMPVAHVSPAQAVVQVPTWLWLEPSYWQTATATESTAAGMSVGVEARPVEAVWDLGEGVQVCEGPGIPWSQAAHDAYEAQPEAVRGVGNPACTFTFRDSSTTQPAGVYRISVSVTWEFSWSLNGVGQGVFGTVEVTDSWDLRVGEIQALITG